MSQPSQTSGRLFQHPGRPEWGRGLLVAERDKLLVIHWEDGREHLVAATHKDRLTPVALAANEESALVDRLKGMQARSTAPAARAAAKKSRSSRPPAPVITLDSQVAQFELIYPGGFKGDKFSSTERGSADSEGLKQWAIDKVKELLAADRFADPAALYDAIVAFLRPPFNLVHPMEGAIPLKSIKEPEQRVALVEALRELLYGSGDYGARFDRFVGAIVLADKDGKTRRPGWPLVTLLPALHDPAQRLFVKPQLLQKQAAILGIKVNYQSAPSASIYEEFLTVGRTLDKRLRDRGQHPRDLLDIATYVSVTLSPNQAESPVIVAAEKPAEEE